MNNIRQNPNNYCIIMAGGTGSRFWPLCTLARPKQFLDLLGTGESMLQSTFRRFAQVCPRENIIVVTSEGMADRVHEQLPGLLGYQVLSEPLRRNTAPCVAYAASVVAQMNPEATLIVTPSDHAVFDEQAFIQNMAEATTVATEHNWIVTMGAQPVNPNTKYGYIQFALPPATSHTPGIHRVITFTEKPPLEMAQQFIASGEFLWNAGIFVWSLATLREAYHKHLPNVAERFFDINFDTPRQWIERLYATTDSISLDFGIMEKADNVYVKKVDFGWSDVETWDSLWQTLPHDPSGNALLSTGVVTYDSHDNMILLRNHQNVVIQGLDNYIVAESPEVLLICPRTSEEMLLKFASDLELRNRRQHTGIVATQ
ncbi:MAG: mannose-1-phosphate guanylyltransferase [Bacteroidales bacterium]|nr:mannose-1-phosphate guanylyltransferase [Bacteroidales bacterium]